LNRNYDKEKARARRLQKIYNINPEDYSAILSKQGGGCALCGKTPEEEGVALAVDHLHAPPYTIRGILCRYCNHRIIGRHKDADLLRRMATYIETDTGFYAPAPVKRRRKTTRKVKAVDKS
jgi:DNA-directed RNA polymerase subunit RPC12/RpoP